MTTPKVLIPMADYGHDPTGELSSCLSYVLVGRYSSLLETAVPYTAFKKAGFEVQFATETGRAPECDKKMLQGVTQKLLVRTPPLLFPPIIYL